MTWQCISLFAADGDVGEAVIFTGGTRPRLCDARFRGSSRHPLASVTRGLVGAGDTHPSFCDAGFRRELESHALAPVTLGLGGAGGTRPRLCDAWFMGSRRTRPASVTLGLGEAGECA